MRRRLQTERGQVRRADVRELLRIPERIRVIRRTWVVHGGGQSTPAGCAHWSAGHRIV